jgi:putative cell wall-binding protein
LWGEDRYKTAVAVSHAQWKDGTAHAVVLARGDEYADALAGVPFAAQLHGPLLLTDPKALDASVEREIRRVLGDPAWGGTVHILGGEQAVSPAIQARLVAAGYHVVRDGGDTRFATALAVAKYFGLGTDVVVATGDDYADAVSAGPLAASRNAPLLLSDNGRLDSDTLTFVGQHAVINTVGKPATDAVQAAGLIATPFWGADRYATSRLAAQATAGAAGPTGGTAISLATGTGFADALTGGAFAANAHMPLLLVDPNQAAARPTADFLRAWLPALTTVDLFGGTQALPVSLADVLRTTLHTTAN